MSASVNLHAKGEPSATISQRWTRAARRSRVPLGFLFAAFYLWRARPNWRSLCVGAVIALLGVGIRAVASGHVEKNHELATTGPYAYVRNPLYLGSVIIGIGFAVAASDIWIALILVLFFVAVYVPVIRGEESYLRSQFSGYADYARRVPSLLPRTLWFAGVLRGFSRELYFRHREYNVPLGAAAMLTVLVAKILWIQR